VKLNKKTKDILRDAREYFGGGDTAVEDQNCSRTDSYETLVRLPYLSAEKYLPTYKNSKNLVEKFFWTGNVKVLKDVQITIED